MNTTIRIVSLIIMIGSLLLLNYIGTEFYKAAMVLLGAFTYGVLWNKLTEKALELYDKQRLP